MTPDMTHYAAVHHKLGEASRRIRILLVSHWVARTVCWTALACAIWLAAAKVGWAPSTSAQVIGAILAASAVAGAVIGGTRKLSRRDVAALTDERTALKERLSTAVEFEAAGGANAFANLQMADADAHARDLDLRRA